MALGRIGYLVYAVVIGSIGLWFLFVAVLGALTLATILLVLFYGLMVTVERIAGTR